MSHFVYILRCADDTLYIGSTPDLDRRLYAHNHLKSGARYTSSRRPVTLLYSEQYDTLHEARVREARLKKLTRAQKLALIKQHQVYVEI
jgi:putative endonuclease